MESKVTEEKANDPNGGSLGCGKGEAPAAANGGGGGGCEAENLSKSELNVYLAGIKCLSFAARERKRDENVEKERERELGSGDTRAANVERGADCGYFIYALPTALSACGAPRGEE